MTTPKTTDHHCRDCGAAVYVKTHGMTFPSGGSDAQRQRAWDATAENWWENASTLAEQHGYSGASACGRLNGWCAPYDESVDDSHRSNGGRVVTFEDDENAPRFVAFAQAIADMLAAVPRMFGENLAIIIADDAEEKAAEERAAAMPGRLAEALRAAVRNLEEMPRLRNPISRATLRDNLADYRAILADYDKDDNA